MASQFLDSMKSDKVESVTKLRIKKKLLKLGYTEKQIQEYEDNRIKIKHKMSLKITEKQRLVAKGF